MLPASLLELHDEFMAECRYAARLSPATLKNYQATFDLLVKVLPTVSAATLSSTTLTNFFRELDTRQRLSRRGSVRRGVKASTVAAYRAKLQPFFKWLKRKGHLASSPFDSIPVPKVVYDEPKFLRRAQVERLITVTGFSIPWSSLFIQKRNLAVLTVFLYLGLRKNELLYLKLMDVDMERREIRIGAASSKSKSYKVLPMNPDVYRRLSDYLTERQRIRATSPLCFTAEDGTEPFTENSLKRMISRIGRAAGISFHVHQLRHTFAVNLINSGSDITVVQKLMGHKNISSTLTYLRCIPPETLQRSVASLSLDSLV